MNPEGEKFLKELCRQMEEEILSYHLLAEEMNKESECLRKGSTNSLLESLRSLEVQTAEIRKIHESTRKSIEQILGVLEVEEEKKDLSRLLALLPPGESQRIKDYQKTLESLKKWIAQINGRNRAFIEQSLAYWREFFSLLTQPLGETPVYVQSGKTQPLTHVPVSLNRKV